MPDTNHEADKTLSPEQQTALERLLIGDTVTAAARAAGVHRATVHRWLQSDFEFQAAWNRGRSELRDATATKLLKLAPKALAAIERALDAGDVQISLAVLKGLGMLTGKPLKIASGNAAEIASERWWNGILTPVQTPPETSIESRPKAATRRMN